MDLTLLEGGGRIPLLPPKHDSAMVHCVPDQTTRFCAPKRPDENGVLRFLWCRVKHPRAQSTPLGGRTTEQRALCARDTP